MSLRIFFVVEFKSKQQKSNLIAMSMYLCYLIVSIDRRRTYVGVTNNFKRRIRQHNGEITGGARATSSVKARPWSPVVTVHGFRDYREALQLEWAWKHEAPRRAHGLPSRLTKLVTLCNKERWTQNAPPSSEVPLQLRFHTADRPLTLPNLPNFVSVVSVCDENQQKSSQSDKYPEISK